MSAGDSRHAVLYDGVAQPHTHWRLMPVASLGAGSGITPVKDTWYTVLDTNILLRIKYVSIKHTNDEAAAKTCALRLTMDGITLTNSATLNNNTWYYLRLSESSDSVEFVTIGNMGKYISFDGRKVKLEARTTSVIGTNPVLYSNVKYEKLVNPFNVEEIA